VCVARLHEAHARLHEAHARLHEAHARLHEARARLHEAHARLHEARARLHEARARLHEARARLAALNPKHPCRTARSDNSLPTKPNDDTLVSLSRTHKEHRMSQIEFETMVDRGTINVPSEYRGRIHGRVRVIIITDEAEDDIDMIEHLMQHPLNAHNATPLTRDEIYDRVK
jgi:uncharacterized coiled-coil DUF342 family protein